MGKNLFNLLIQGMNLNFHAHLLCLFSFCIINITPLLLGLPSLNGLILGSQVFSKINKNILYVPHDEFIIVYPALSSNQSHNGVLPFRLQLFVL